MKNQCQVCKSFNVMPLDYKNRFLNHFICKNCGLVYIWPIPTKEVLESYYKEDASYKEQGLDLDFSGKISKMDFVGVMGDVDYILRNSGLQKNNETHNKDRKKVLEIGSSTGRLLNAFKVKGFDVMGIEPSELAFKYSKLHYSLPVINDVLENVKIKEKFDLILAIHMLEHVNDPFKLLSKIRGLLKEKGVLYIKVSNLYKPNMNLKRFFIPIHLINYSPKALVNMLAVNKFKLLKADTNGPYIDMFFIKDSRIKLKVDNNEYKRELNFLRKYKRSYFLKLTFLKVFFIEKIYHNLVNIIIKILPFSWSQKIRKIIKG
jgi:2-polyprenyl-3-methyl-5-hydroxy-6-metoxy-1,4-benzoquinol methylase